MNLKQPGIICLFFLKSGEFESSQGLLTGSMKRINHMVSSGKGNRKLMCYIILGLIVLFFLSYYLISKVTGGWSQYLS